MTRLWISSKEIHKGRQKPSSAKKMKGKDRNSFHLLNYYYAWEEMIIHFDRGASVLVPQNSLPAQNNKNHIENCKNILPQKFEDSWVYWQIYLSSGPRIWAPTPVNRGPYCNSSKLLNFLGNAGFSTEYIKQKLCLHSGIDTLKNQPSKNSLLLPSKWYLRHQSNMTYTTPMTKLQSKLSQMGHPTSIFHSKYQKANSNSRLLHASTLLSKQILHFPILSKQLSLSYLELKIKHINLIGA